MKGYANPAVAAFAGVVFGLGLAISGMIDPAKVKSFLDVAAAPLGAWDPSLAFVMIGAIAVAFPFFRQSGGLWRARPVDVAPPSSAIDLRLIGGAALFGVGWGLSGLCPGPAIADLSLAPLSVIGFGAAMLIGSWATGIALRRSAGRLEALSDAPAE
ncbi:MAG: DUF6691 family protein [Bauldia sp.]